MELQRVRHDWRDLAYVQVSVVFIWFQVFTHLFITIISQNRYYLTVIDEAVRLGNSPKVSELAPCIIGRHNCIRQLWLGYAVAINGPENLESESEVAQLCPTVCNPMDCSLLGSSVRGFFQARILEWVAISFSRRSSQYRDWTQVSHIVGRALPSGPPGKMAQLCNSSNV